MFNKKLWFFSTKDMTVINYKIFNRLKPVIHQFHPTCEAAHSQKRDDTVHRLYELYSLTYRHIFLYQI